MSPRRPGPPLQPSARPEFPEIKASIYAVRSNLENGDRFLTLRIGKQDAGTIAALSLYEGIVFKVKFVPEEVKGEAEGEAPL